MIDPSIPRDSRRVPLETRVQLKFERFSGFISEFSANISPGGIFIRTDRPEPVGTLVGFEFRLDDGFELIRGQGEVVWVRAEDDGPERPAGMGLRFREITPQGRDLIYMVVDRHIQSGGTPFDLAAAPPVPAAPAPLLRPRASEPPIRSASSLLSLFEEASAEAGEPDPSPGPAPAGPPRVPQAVEPPAVPVATVAAPPPLERTTHSPRAPLLAPPPEVPFRTGPLLPPPPRPRQEALEDTASLTPKATVPPARGVAAVARPERRRRPLRTVVLAVLIFLALASTAAWRLRDLWWDDFFGDPDPEPLPAAFAHPGREPMYRTLPKHESPPAGVAASPAPALSASAGPTPAAPAVPEPGKLPVQIAASAAPSPVPPAAPAAALPAPSAPAAASPVAPAAESQHAVFQNLVRISFRALPGETEVTLQGDGILRASNYAQFRIDAGTPRELVKFKGARHPYPTPEIPVGTPELLRIRTGYHSPDELHIVFDLASPQVRVLEMGESATALTVRLGRRKG